MKSFQLFFSPVSKMSIHQNGYWEGLEASCQHVHDEKLADALCVFFKNEAVKDWKFNFTLADFGCGMGDYVKRFIRDGLNARGFDGNPNTHELTNGVGEILDLSKPKQFDEKFNWILSLEVGEHLPKTFEDIFIQNLHNNNKHGIVLSWAVKEQGGSGHVNEQNNDYVKKKMMDLGYTNDIESENKLRESATLWWFKNTIMVFRK